LHPGGGERAQQEVPDGQHEEGAGQGAPEAEAVGQRPAQNGHEPDHEAVVADEPGGLRAGEAEPLVQVDGEDGLGPVVGEPLEQLGEVRDPEGSLEPGAHLLPALRETHAAPFDVGG
jgi:hypothetical protein